MATARTAARPAPETEAPAETGFDRLQRARRRLDAGGGAERIAKQHEKGKLTARERLDVLLDENTFVEVEGFAVAQGTSRVPAGGPPGDGVVAGFGEVDGRPVAVYAQDFTVNGGSLGATTARKIVRVIREAAKTGIPVVGINDSGGARIQEGVASLGGYGDIFRAHVQASGVVPQIAVVLGPCAGGAVYGPALCDLIVMGGPASHMFVTGPDVVRTVTGEDTTFDHLGGTDIHAATSGVVHLTGADDVEALLEVRRALSYLPGNNLDAPPAHAAPEQADHDPCLRELVPRDAKASYDVRDVLDRVLDARSLMEVQPTYARNVVVGFARLGGAPVGVIANQPKHLAGVLDTAASEKAARFIRLCDNFNVPIVSFVDVPGFLPGLDQEHGGIIRRGAKLLYAYAEATVPKLTVITRKAYGGAYIVMGSKHLGADLNLAWPDAEIAVLGAEAAVNILHRRRLADAPDPDALRGELEGDYRERLADPFYAAELGFVDDVVDPADTRRVLRIHLKRLASKREATPERKHGNIPL